MCICARYTRACVKNINIKTGIHVLNLFPRLVSFYDRELFACERHTHMHFLHLNFIPHLSRYDTPHVFGYLDCIVCILSALYDDFWNAPRRRYYEPAEDKNQRMCKK